jgi:myosin-1
VPSISIIGDTVAESPLAENVAFSSRIQLLVSKFGRSSKLSPRYLALVCRCIYLGLGIFLTWEKTGKAVYIIVNAQTKDGATQIALERKVPLITIKSIAMSNLRDDWMVSAKIELYQLVFTHGLLFRF